MNEAWATHTVCIGCYLDLNPDALTIDRGGSRVSIATCEAFVEWDARNEFCGEPAIGTTFAACEHEHINERPTCAGCAAELQRETSDDDPWMCAHCDHECEFRIEIRFDGGETVVLQGARP